MDLTRIDAFMNIANESGKFINVSQNETFQKGIIENSNISSFSAWNILIS